MMKSITIGQRPVNGTAKKYLEDSEVMKVSTRELKEQVLSPDEPSVDIVRIGRQASEMEGATKRVGGAGEAMEHLSERKTRSFGCSDGGQDEHAEDSTRRLSEADLPGAKGAGAEDKGSAGTRTKEPQVKGERARTSQRWESSRAMGQWSGFGSRSSSLAFDTDEAMSASSWMAKEADEAISESSWTLLAKGKESRLAKSKCVRFSKQKYRTASRRFPARCCRSSCCCSSP